MKSDNQIKMNTLKKRLTGVFILFFSIFQKQSWRGLKPCNILLIRHDNDCGYTFHDKAYAQIIDSFGEFCTRRGLTVRSVAFQNSKIAGNMAFFSPVLINHPIIAIRYVRALFNLIGCKKTAKKWSESSRTILWCKILEKSRSNCIVAIQPDEYLCRAGKLMGIPVFDIQHGVIADDHPWYGESFRSNIPRENLPDGFLCWNDQSADTIRKWAGTKGIRVITIGNPWFLRFLWNISDDILVSEALTGAFFDDDQRPCIIVSLQWGLSNEYPQKKDNRMIVDALEKVVLDTIDEYNWIMKIHPVQMRGSEREMLLSYFTSVFGSVMTEKWVSESNIPLPVLLKKADLHITDFSTVVIEAAWMGVRSGLLNDKLGPGGKRESYYAHERNIGIAEILPQDPIMIKQWITVALRKGKITSTLADTTQNLNAFINEIVQRTHE